MRKKNAKQLLDDYASGNCTPEERALVEYWFAHGGVQQETDSVLPKSHAFKLRMWRSMQNSMKNNAFYFGRIAAALLLLCSVSAVSYFYFHRTEPDSPPPELALKPAAGRAILTLSDGRKILLDTAGSEKVIEGSINIREENGEIIYGSAANEGEGEEHLKSLIHTIETPNGGHYRVTLPDGSRVWLNAASSLRYPAHFDRQSRQVELVGEAYFEVARKLDHPFIVKSRDQEIEVLGTSFDVNAYPEQPESATTLVEGRVRLSDTHSKQQVLLHANQQGLIRQGGQHIVVSEVEAEEYLAWKEGYFLFDGSDLEAVMRDVARWYDVEVSFEDNALRQVRFSGTVSRYDRAEMVLDKIERVSDVQFIIQGRTVQVKRKLVKSNNS